MSSSDLWDEADAAAYDESSAHMFEPAVLGPAVETLADLADGGPALEFAIGTGRVAIPLAERGVPVTGIELSAPMVARLQEKVAADRIPATVGDMATTRVEGSFSLVYLVWNTLGNVRTQDEQVAVFANAAAHLRRGGRFVVEIGVPPLRRLPPGQAGVPFHVGDDHVGLDTLDPATQQVVSHHFSRTEDGSWRRGTHHYRLVWPAELDLMARLAGMTLEHRWEDFERRPFTAESEQHVSVWRL